MIKKTSAVLTKIGQKNMCYKDSNFRVCEKVAKMGARQLSLIPRKREEIEFGGNLLKGKRKSRRPISLKKPMHLVLKSSNARGKFALAPSNRKVETLIYKMANRFGVKLYSVALNWSHAHLVLRVWDRKSYNRFIRALTGAMVLVLKAPKGFFDLKPYTKIGTWGRQLRNWVEYSIKNELEAAGLMIRKPNLEKRAGVTIVDEYRRFPI